MDTVREHRYRFAEAPVMHEDVCAALNERTAATLASACHGQTATAAFNSAAADGGDDRDDEEEMPFDTVAWPVPLHGGRSTGDAPRGPQHGHRFTGTATR